jgi:Ni/Fe-hydrogenase subunit HybB-like protein
VLFWVSAIAVGLAMVIFESGLSARAFGLKFEFGLLQSISRGMGAFLIAFLTLRFVDLIWRGSIHHAFVATGPGSYEAGMFWLEILFFAAALVGLFVPDVRDNPRGLWGCAVMVVSGFVLNRLNVSITGLEASSGVRYYPSWAEAAITASIVVVGLILFTLAAKHLPVLHGKEAHSEANS